MMALVSSVYRWVGRSYRIEPIGLAAARQRIRVLSSKAELKVTVEAVRGMGNVQVAVRHSRKHREV